jgi:hypothetical protein
VRHTASEPNGGPLLITRGSLVRSPPPLLIEVLQIRSNERAPNPRALFVFGRLSNECQTSRSPSTRLATCAAASACMPGMTCAYCLSVNAGDS